MLKGAGGNKDLLYGQGGFDKLDGGSKNGDVCNGGSGEDRKKAPGCEKKKRDSLKNPSRAKLAVVKADSIETLADQRVYLQVRGQGGVTRLTLEAAGNHQRGQAYEDRA